MKWAQEYQKLDRRVAKTEIGDISISTAFLGIDHSMCKDVPLLFETMVFGGKYDELQWRYTTWEEAEAGHDKVVALVKEAL